MHGTRPWAGVAAAALMFIACGGEGEVPSDASPEVRYPTWVPEWSEPQPPSASWCERLVPGATSEQPVGVAWSAAHAQIRFSSPVESYGAVDGALAQVMREPDALDRSATLVAYAEAVGEVCAVDRAEGWLGDVELHVVGSTLVVKPGYGEVVVPNIAHVIAVDLRGLPAVPALESILARSVAPAIHTPIPRLPARVRAHHGMTDEIFSPSNVYRGDVVEIDRGAIEGSGPRDLPIVLMVDDRLAPAAAAFALDIRFARRGWIVGEDIPARVAEGRFGAVGDGGLFWRTMELVTPGCEEPSCASMATSSLARRLPDVIRADERLDDPFLFTTTALGRDLPQAYALDEKATRRPLTVEQPWMTHHEPEGDLGTGRAALLIAHGALDMFFPCFDVVGDRIDLRLSESLETVQGLNQHVGKPMWHLLRRFGEAIHDGNNYVATPHDSAGILPARFDHIDGEPVVIRSLAAELQAGDVVVAWDGVPIAEIYEAERLRTSAATPQHQDVLISEHLRWLDGPVTLTLRSPEGGTRTETVAPAPASSFAEIPLASMRPSGWLDDMGAPNVYYLNLDGAVSQTLGQVNLAIDDALTADGMIVDMRGSPAVDHYAIVQRLTPRAVRSPRFGIPTWTGTEREIVWEQYTLRANDKGGFTGKLILLVSPKTVGVAEELAMMLTRVSRVTVVGRASAGTSGNVTGLRLPGGAKIGFTGMEVQWPEGGTFHGVGVQPQVEVTPTAVGIAMGEDEVLEAAIDGFILP